MDPITLWTQIGLFVLGLVMLFFGAEWTVRGSSTLATRLGISPIVVGVTIVALGTSAPELVVGIVAALQGAPEIALGNVIGSNIANLGLIVGLSGLIYPFRLRRATLKYEIPMFLLTAFMLFAMASNDGLISRADGIVLVVVGALFNYLFVTKSLKDTKAKASIETAVEKDVVRKEKKDKSKGASIVLNLILTFIGIALLCGGAHLMVTSATKVAHDQWGWSMVVIGLTIVAVGTSLPELAASIMAGVRQQSEIALGNVLGSNIYNVVLIIGVVSIIAPLKVGEAVVGFDLPVMMIFTIVFTVFLITSMELERWEAAILFLGYISFMVLLYLRETGVQSFIFVFG